ncbi:unnamed protein product [Arctia plantaginis]|uniref:Larval cuticle protein 1 n=1 Tax=Arctia plantaginis TaxID=874455 RepID=A0A8S0YQE1_ARCPL|nr:unnamed protein product [Arctia plantaginis]CAB3243571.1 unnamed protein product [Arctia plantaginis]
MKFIILIACAFFAVALAAPAETQPEPVKILRSDINQETDGSYSVVIETDDGYKRQENGEIREVPNEEGKLVKVIVVRGSYVYNDPNGQPQSITYIADENGFQAEGPSIPKNPEP